MLKTLWPYFKGYEKECVLAPLFKLLEALMSLLVPLVVADIIDKGIVGGNTHYIWLCFWLMLGLAVLEVGFSFTAQWYAAKGAVGFTTSLRQALFDHIQALSYTELDTLGTDTLITRMTSDMNQVQTGLNLALRLLLRSPFVVFGSMVMAFTIDVRCALIFVVAIPILSAVVLGIMIKSIPLFTKAQQALDRLLGTTRENLTGVRVIRAFCKEKDEVKEFDEKNEFLTHMNETVGKLSALMNPATYLLVNLATVVLIREGALRVNLGGLAQGDVVALYNYMAQMIIELVKLAALIITINKSIACAERLESVMQVKPGMDFPKAGVQLTKPQAGVPEVAFRHVSFAYAGSGAEAVTNIDFAAQPGETIGIIGGTGSGKSTVVNLIPRFYDATSGIVEIAGKNVKDYAEGALHERIGVVPQRATLFEGSIRDNLKWGKEDATDEELWQAIDTAQAHEVVEGKPGQLDYQLEQNGRNLSGGQKQRLTIARALVRKPDILILDDSASALDFVTDLKLRQAIKKLEGNMTVFIVSQRTSSVRYADQILVLSDGKLVGKGTHDQLMQNCEVYQEIYYSQYPEERPKDRPLVLDDEEAEL